MAKAQAQTQDNPFGGSFLDNIAFGLGGGSLAGALFSPAMGPWGMLAGLLFPELMEGGMFNPEGPDPRFEGKHATANPFENVAEPTLADDVWSGGFMTSPQTGQQFLSQLDPQLYPAFQMATEQTANQNRMATENYNRWAQATEGAYQNAADILMARSGMYQRGS